MDPLVLVRNFEKINNLDDKLSFSLFLKEKYDNDNLFFEIYDDPKRFYAHYLEFEKELEKLDQLKYYEDDKIYEFIAWFLYEKIRRIGYKQIYENITEYIAGEKRILTLSLLSFIKRLKSEYKNKWFDAFIISVYYLANIYKNNRLKDLIIVTYILIVPFILTKIGGNLRENVYKKLSFSIMVIQGTTISKNNEEYSQVIDDVFSVCGFDNNSTEILYQT